MGTYWTIESNGTEKTLADWGIRQDFHCSRVNKGLGRLAQQTVEFSTIERIDPGAIHWVYFDKGTVWRDRVSAAGEPNSFSGGSRYFQGYFDDPQREGDEGRQNIVYRLHSVLWLFELEMFKQWRNQFASWDPAHRRVQATNVASGGTGYKVGDVLTVSGTGTPAQVTVTAISGGGASGPATIVSVTNNGGSYTTDPTSPNAATGGHGTGILLNLVMSQVPLVTPIVLPEVYLGEYFDKTNDTVRAQHSGDQVREICNWMNEVMNPTRRGAAGGFDLSQDVLQIGTIDPHSFLPISRYNTIFCSEALSNALRFDPDAVTYDDPSTVPPTVNTRKFGRWNYATTPPTFLDYANLPEVVINITTDQEQKLHLQSQENRKLSGVRLYYKSVNVVDGQQSVQVVVDSFPPGITDFTPFVSSHCIDLAGSRSTHVRANVRVASISQLYGPPADMWNWWEAHDDSLKDPLIDPGSVHVIGLPQMVDKNGVNVYFDAGALSELLESSLPDWVPGVYGIRVSVMQNLSYTRHADPGRQIAEQRIDPARGKLHTKRIVLTNANGPYSALSSFESAELVPQNVAESVYRSLAAQQWAGSITFVRSQLRSDIGLGMRLRLIGPTTTFENLLVQSVEDYPARGTTVVGFAPCSPVDLEAWIELARATRTRTTYNMPSGRSDGLYLDAYGDVDTGNTPAMNDTAKGLGGNLKHGVALQLN